MFKPQLFGRYTLLDRLAVGGMAEIYLARLATEDRICVIKRMLPHFSTDQDFVEMFIDEARISATLDHHNIVPVFDLGKVAEDCFIAMEYIDGKDLQAVLTILTERQSHLAPDHVAFVGQEMARGLHYAHTKKSHGGEELKLVHRDISPQNILVSYDGRVMITDFGIAKAESKLNQTQAGILKGKFSYMSPEQVMGREIDHRHDLFSAGIILYELLAGHRLFTGKVEWEILQKVRLGHIEPLTHYNPNVPKTLQKIVYRALAVDRDKRYSSAQELEYELASYLGRNHPNYSESDLAGLMQNLFEKEMEDHRERVRSAIGQLTPRPKADLGARLESTVADQRTKVSHSGPHPSPPPPPTKPSMEEVVSSRLGTDPRARAPRQPSVRRIEPGDSGTVEEPSTTRTLWILLLVGLGVLAVAIGTVAAVQPPWLFGEETTATTPTVRATGTAVGTTTVEATAEPTATPIASLAEATPIASSAEATPIASSGEATPTASSAEATPLPAGAVRLLVTSTPAGADVVVDGTAYGKTPATINALATDKRVIISVTKEGYSSSSRPWFATEGSHSLDFRLKKAAVDTTKTDKPQVAKPGFLSVNVTNGSGRVFIDGAMISTTTPVVRYRLKPGRHRLRVENPTTGQSRTLDIVVKSGRLTEHDIRL